MSHNQRPAPALFPLFANLDGREVLVVGGGDVAQRKIEALLHAGARVQVHAHALNDGLQQWLAQGRLRRLDGDFNPDWLDQAWLLIAATDDRAFNATLAAEAAVRRRLANIVDDAELSTFQVPAIVDRAPLQIAISSGGAAPMLARRVREQLETLLDHSLGEFAQLFARHRAAIRRRLPQLAQRRRWFERVIDGPVPVLLQAGQTSAAEQAFEAALENSADTPAAGSVILLDTGNGDPGLVTLKALRALNQADLLLCAEGVSPAILALARRDANRSPLPDEEPSLLTALVGHVHDGLRVVCLQPGNAFQASAGDALMRQLSRHGIDCAVIPGTKD